MFQPDALSLGLLFLLGAGIFFLLVLRFSRMPQPEVFSASDPSTTADQDDPGDAVLVIQAGGRPVYANRKARDLFHLRDGELPNLERLARRIRPSGEFLTLCALGPQAQFVLDGRLVEGSSYRLALQPGDLTVVTLRDPSLNASLASKDGVSSKTMRTFIELTQSIAASLDLSATLHSCLEAVEKLVPADWIEITLWDGPDALTRYSLDGEGSQRKLVSSGGRLSSSDGCTYQLVRDRRPLLLTDTAGHPDIRPAADRSGWPVRSYLGLPLLAGDELVGILELGSMTAGAFRPEDLDVIAMLAGQAAAAVQNALVYEGEQQRMAELRGLAQLSQAFGSASDPHTLFSRLVESIIPLIRVEILGFLLYNEVTRTLESQAPFSGLPDQFLEMYRLPVQPNSPLELAMMKQDSLITANAAEDPVWEALGLGPMAHGASLRETALIPLNSGGRLLGYLQASNHSLPAPFSPDELHLLGIVANQAAPVIENLTLIQQSRQRAQRAEALRRIASLASSAANLDEILRFALQELTRLLGADVAGIFLLGQNSGELQFKPSTMFGSLEPLPDRLGCLRMDDAQFHFTVTGSQRALFTGSLSEEQAVIPFYQSIQDYWQIESVVITPLVVRDEGIGELWMASRSINAFDKGTLQVAATAAGQLAGVVEQAFLVAQTDESLHRRLAQLTALNRISRELSTSLDVQYLLQLVHDEAIQAARADCGTILLFDLDRPASGAPRVRLSIGDPVNRDLLTLEKLAIETNGPINIPDVAQAEYTGAHEGIQSVLLVPITYHGKQAGLMSLHSRLPGQFDTTAIEISQSLAVQAAVVLGNALQYEQQSLKRGLDSLGKLFDVSRSLLPNLPQAELYTAITRAVCAATPFRMAVFNLYEPAGDCLRPVCAEGLPPGAWETLQGHTVPWNALQSLLQPEYCVGAAYFIPADRRPVAADAIFTVTVLPGGESGSADAWDAGDLLFLPLYDREKKPLGMISVDAPRDGRRPDWQAFELLEMFALQASMLVQSSHRIAELSARADAFDLEARKLREETQSAAARVPELQKREEEQGAALRSFERQAERLRAGLELAEQANRQPNTKAVLMTVARELLARFGMQVALLAETTPAGPQLLDVIGILPSGANPLALFGQRNPLRQVVQDRALLMVSDLEAEPEWKDNPLLKALFARSFIGIPLSISDHQVTGVLVAGQDALPAFTEEDRQAFTQVSRQVSVGLQNLELLTQTRRRLREMDILVDFSRKLGSFTPDGILRALLDSAMQILPAAQCGWAGLWDNKTGELVPQVAAGYSDRDSMLAIRMANRSSLEADPALLPLPVRAYATGKPLLAQDVQFARDYNLPPEDLLFYRRASGGRLPVSTLAIPVRLGSSTLGVMVLENFSSAANFSDEDQNLSLSLAGQAALALENTRLLQSAERRAAQLQALTRVAGTITTSLSSEDLVASLLGQLNEVLPYDTATLWLRKGNELSVADASGFEDNQSLLGLSVSVEDSSLFHEMADSGRPILVPDVRQDPRFPSLAEPERISWLGIPLIAKGQLIGVIAIEKIEAGFYSDEHLRAATTFASQAAVALENARLFEESQRRAAELDERSSRLALLNRLSGDLGATLEVDTILDLTAREILNAMRVSSVSVILMDGGKFTIQAEAPGTGAELPIQLPPTPLLYRLQETHGLFSTSDVAQEPDLAPLVRAYLAPRGARSLLIVPLLTGSDLHGWILLQSDRDYRFSTSEMELARTIANQAATAVQNARLFAETRRLTEDLERRVEERTTEVTREHHNSQTLLRIISELSASLDMDLVLNRTLTVLNESVGAQQCMVVLSQGSGKAYNAGTDLVGLRANGKSNGRLDQEIARWVTRRRMPALVPDVITDDRWNTQDRTLTYRSVLAVPLILGEDSLGTLLLFHRDPEFFAKDQMHLVEATARQIGIALNNADLFNLIRDQAENLGGMLRDQQVAASRSRAILEAVADGVVVTEASNAITLFNASAERILGLEAREVLGKSLEQFSGLFGKAAAAWMGTIRRWSEDARAYQEGETYAQQLELDNGSVVQIHLAPVIMRSEFLGTVSIFRDITHEVQVDRLKTEFVANVSHELRTPMTSIKGYVDIMLMGAAGDLDPRVRHFLEIVKGNTERLNVLVNDLLDVSRIESGRVSLTMRDLDLKEIARDVITDITRRSREENKAMGFALDIPDDLPFVSGDLERVRQILGNLVSNGYQYTPEGGQVTVRMAAGDGEVTVDVVDNGIGIAPQDQKRIFERFYRGEDPLVLATAGNGLGLAITTYLVEMHNGRLWFQSSGVRGEGSTFSFSLPACKNGGDG